MKNENSIKILSSFTNNFLVNVFAKVDLDKLSDTDFGFIDLLDEFQRDFSKLSISECLWFVPTSEFDLSRFGFAFYGKFHSELRTTYIFARGTIDFSELSEQKVVISESENSIHVPLIEISDDKSKVDAVWQLNKNQISDILSEQKIKDDRGYIVDKIDALNQLAELDMLDDEGFMTRLEYILQLSYHEDKRVWGEYNQVSRISKQPVLMNKAMSIALTKIQVVGLVKKLSSEYAKQLQAILFIRQHLSRTGGLVPVVFGTTMRGHADPNNFYINLPKLGDWRMGYNGKYSAELVFHEFAHVVDFGRDSRGSSGARSDVHRHDFVHILDNILLQNKEWIERKYDANFHYDQIINNSKYLHEFESKRKYITNDIATFEKYYKGLQEQQKEKLSSKVGISSTEFPLHKVTGVGNTKMKLDYLKWCMTQYVKDSTVQNERSQASKLLNKLNSDSIVLDRTEMTLLIKLIAKYSRTKFSYTLPIKEQMDSLSVLKDFDSELTNLSNGTLKDLKPSEPSVTVELYSDEYLIKGLDRLLSDDDILAYIDVDNQYGTVKE